MREILEAGPAVLKLEKVSKSYAFRRTSWLDRRRHSLAALQSVSLDVRAGEVLAIIGESGSGKSTLARIIANLILPSEGRVFFEGLSHGERDRHQRLDLCRKVQLIHQDNRGALDPRMTVGAQLIEPLRIHGIGDRAEQEARRDALLRQVGLAPTDAGKLPHMLSGGQRQRVVIARALALAPRILVCDEPVSSLDATIQLRIIDLLMEIRRQSGTTLIFITHDLRLAARISDRIAVLYKGELVELADAGEVLVSPRHPYARSLISTLTRARKRNPSGLAVIKAAG